nr:MAG TPA: hypothetical protein [Caudoviricetes sp.]
MIFIRKMQRWTSHPSISVETTLNSPCHQSDRLRGRIG